MWWILDDVLFWALLSSWILSRWQIVKLEELLDSYRELDDERVKTIEDLQNLLLETSSDKRSR
jgi:hypothetical protein